MAVAGVSEHLGSSTGRICWSVPSLAPYQAREGAGEVLVQLGRSALCPRGRGGKQKERQKQKQIESPVGNLLAPLCI